MRKFFVPAILICTAMAVSSGAGKFVSAGSNTDYDVQTPGQMPYEMVNRTEPKPLLTFDDCSGWSIESDGAVAYLNRTRNQQMFGHCSGALCYMATDSNSSITVRAKNAIAIPEPWDCLSIWVYGNSWQYGDVVGPLDMDIILQDASGKEVLERLSSYYKGSINYKYWWLLRIKIRDITSRPVKLVGFKFSGSKIAYPGKSETIYLGPMYAYQEQLKSVAWADFPEKLPFPTRSETILPLNKSMSFTNSVSFDGKNYVFVYSGEDGKLIYQLDPKIGRLSGINLLHNGKMVRPCAGGDAVIAGDHNDGNVVNWKHLGEQLKDNVVIAGWEASTGSKVKKIEFRYYMRQKSLVVEMEEDASSDGIVKNVRLGGAEGVKSPKLIRVPMLNFDYKEAPRLLYSDGLFYFTQFDWYYSQASLFYAKEFAADGDKAVFNGGALYNAKTDGTRNAMRERLFINVSADVQEVLPTIPNPKSPMRSLMCDKAWMTINCVGMTHEDRLRIPRVYRSLGMENVAVRYHEGTWRDGGESFTFRSDASPKQGGNDALREMVTSVRSLGWLCGLYTNYTDFTPVNPTWNEDWLRLDENGDWNSSWYGCYSVKPVIAWQEQIKYAPVIHQKYGTNHCYCDVHTAVPPFARVDHDARVPGAATFRKTFEIYGMLMMREREAHKGPIYSEGGNHWWYAGLIDGSYANAFPPLTEQRLFVDFELLKIHPLEMDAGAVSGVFDEKMSNRDSYVPYTLAYGHICQLTPYGEAESMRRYYLIAPIQQYYAMVPVKAIRYWNGKELLNSSQALASDANAGGVFVEYASGCKIWANIGTEPWKIKVRDSGYVLAKNGFYAESPDGKITTSSFISDQAGNAGEQSAVDFASGPDSHYLNTGGNFVSFGRMAGKGAAVLKKEKSGWELIPARAFTEIGFEPFLIGLEDVGVEVEGVDQNGVPQGNAEVSYREGKVWVKPGQNKAFKYRIIPAVKNSVAE